MREDHSRAPIRQGPPSDLPGSGIARRCHGGAELDLLFMAGGRRYGVEVKMAEAPEVTRSMHVALETLHLSHVYVVYPGRHLFSMTERFTAVPAAALHEI